MTPNKQFNTYKEELQIESLLVGVELLVRCHIRQLSDSWV